MSGPRPKTCAACGRGIAANEVYYRFSLVLQGEQDVLGPSGGSSSEDELAALVKQLEESQESAQELEEQVHWERSGVVCSACRSVVVRTLSAPPEAAGHH
ncbi:hypothetical protein BO221_13830 [Archangium sp. Cb G35]|uniref:hypothetical protein n=1 Tax=Archangium sp. Cb G35 TaxID=1920190 RepID=UPI000936A131|nr:hypothetical protein [Archangium sp. Cb G35]OJT24254.1 hypothetical protein BO221_13830 [Archangium sp. Cb G35]